MELFAGQGVLTECAREWQFLVAEQKDFLTGWDLRNPVYIKLLNKEQKALKKKQVRARPKSTCCSLWSHLGTPAPCPL